MRLVRDLMATALRENMTSMIRLGTFGTLSVALLLSACTSTTSAPTRPSTSSLGTTSTTTAQMGVVAGVVAPCEGGPARPGPPSTVTVKLYAGPTLLASKATRSRTGYRFRFSVAPGKYRVASWWVSIPVKVRAGEVSVLTVKISHPCLAIV